jgi:hypothetical protein
MKKVMTRSNRLLKNGLLKNSLLAQPGMSMAAKQART